MDMTNNVNNKVKKTNKKRLQHSKGFTTTMLDKTQEQVEYVKDKVVKVVINIGKFAYNYFVDVRKVAYDATIGTMTNATKDTTKKNNFATKEQLKQVVGKGNSQEES